MLQDVFDDYYDYLHSIESPNQLPAYNQVPKRSVFRTGISDAFSTVLDPSDLLNFLKNELANMLFMFNGTIMNIDFIGNTTQVFLSMRGA